MKKVAIVMGSESDAPSLRGAAMLLEKFGLQYEAHVFSAHRTPAKAAAFATAAESAGFGVIIAAAGKAAHLAGVLAAHTTLPVIGVPVRATALDGLDALLSTVQMPRGIPVATVAIDGGDNAALLAVSILALGDKTLAGKLRDFRQEQTQAALDADARLNEKGLANY